jgi:hypothetical protein
MQKSYTHCSTLPLAAMDPNGIRLANCHRKHSLEFWYMQRRRKRQRLCQRSGFRDTKPLDHHCCGLDESVNRIDREEKQLKDINNPYQRISIWTGRL